MMENVEIEIKIKLDDPAVMMEWLKSNASLVKVSDQDDVYFDPPDRTFIHIDHRGYKHADEWFRIRFSEKGSELCYKHWNRDGKGDSTYADEIETTIGDPQQVLEILGRLGFKENSRIKKHRESYKYGDFQFDCDEVEGIGFFVEIEFKGEVEDPMEGKEKIMSMLKEIGVTGFKKTIHGYHYILWNPEKEHYEEERF